MDTVSWISEIFGTKSSRNSTYRYLGHPSPIEWNAQNCKNSAKGFHFSLNPKLYMRMVLVSSFLELGYKLSYLQFVHIAHMQFCLASLRS